MRVLVILWVLLAPALVDARTEGKPLAYAREAVWSTAVRFLAVDEGAKLGDRDADAGYVMFELKDAGKTYRGSLEVVGVVVDGNPSVKFVVTLVDRPPYMELAMLKRLEIKLRNELGSPNPRKPKKEEEKAPPPKDGEKPAEPPKQPPIARDP
jgi:hypothetical protein